MPNLPRFPEDSEVLRRIPVFTAEGLKTARASVITSVPFDPAIAAADRQFSPIAAIEVSFDSALAFTRAVMCDPNQFGAVGVLAGNPRNMVFNDTMSRFVVTLTDVTPIALPGTLFVLPSNNDPAPNVEFQFRASTANSPGDVRWGGLLNFTNVLTYYGMGGFLGKTGGILMSRWEVWARVDPGGTSNNPGSLQMTVHMSVDRLGDVNENVYGNVVDQIP